MAGRKRGKGSNHRAGATPEASGARATAPPLNGGGDLGFVRALFLAAEMLRRMWRSEMTRHASPAEG